MIPDFVTDPNPDLYHDGSYVVLDFETTNTEKGTALNADNRLVLACWAECKDGIVIQEQYKFGGEYEMGDLLEAIERSDFIVAQNAKFELQWLDRCGYDVGSRPVYDTMLAEWVILGNQFHGKLGLDALCKKYDHPLKGKIVKLMMEGGVCPSIMPRSILLRYCRGDVRATHHVFRQQLSAMSHTKFLPIVYTRCLTTLALADIEKNGIFLDHDRVQEEHKKVNEEYVQIVRELDAMSGGVNMNSPQQKAEYIYETLGFSELSDAKGEPIRTPSGNPKTDADTILALEAVTQEQKQFRRLKLRQGKLGAALSKTLDFCKGVVEERGGLFFGELRQATTRTHRLSSSGRPMKFEQFPKPKSCQFQNYPNKYKPLIGARHEGWLVAEGDGGQLEFRIAGHLGRDPVIIKEVTNKDDIHSYTRDVLVEAGEPELTGAAAKDRRRLAKKYTFRPMYGGTSGSEAVQAYNQFFADKYNRLHETQEEWALAASEQKFIETEWGMRYHFPNVYVNKFGYVVGKQQVFNYPIQALATAEIIPIGLVHFWYRTKEADLIITNSVHDSIICELPPYEIELFEESVVKSLTEDVYAYLKKCYNMDLSVPLGVGIKMGEHWTETAFTDEELEEQVEHLRQKGYASIIDDGEITVDVPIPETNYASTRQFS